MVGITPDGAISFFVWRLWRESHQPSKFLKSLQPGDHVMADHGLKILNALLVFHQHSLTIPPGKDTNLQMLKSGIIKISKIANLRT